MSNWISVKDKLPEMEQYVLVRISSDLYPSYHYYAEACRTTIEVMGDDYEIWHSPRFTVEKDGNKVTHWMPLPEEPKESD